MMQLGITKLIWNETVKINISTVSSTQETLSK